MLWPSSCAVSALQLAGHPLTPLYSSNELSSLHWLHFRLQIGSSLCGATGASRGCIQCGGNCWVIIHVLGCPIIHYCCCVDGVATHCCCIHNGLAGSATSDWGGLAVFCWEKCAFMQGTNTITRAKQLSAGRHFYVSGKQRAEGEKQICEQQRAEMM